MTTVIAQQARAAGTYRTASAATSVLPNGTITASAIMNLADEQDPALLITLGVEGNDNPAAAANDPNWYIVVETTWQGSATGSAHFPGTWQPPAVSWSSSVVAAQIMRGHMVISKAISIGLDLAVVAPSIAGLSAEIGPHGHDWAAQIRRQWRDWYRVE